MRLVSTAGVESVTHPQFGSATVGADGVFDVPEDFGRALCAVSATWRDEAAHVAELARRERAELQDPNKALDVLASLRRRVVELEQQLAESTDEAIAARISDLEAEVADLRGRLTGVQAASDGETPPAEVEETEPDDDADVQAPAEPAKKTTAAKKKATQSK